MVRAWLGRDGFRFGAGAVAVAALAAACDSGSSTPVDDVGGAAGTNAAGVTSSAGANGKAGGANTAGAANPMGGMNATSGSSPGGGTEPSGGTPTAGTTSGSGGGGGTVGLAGDGGMSSAGAAGTPSGEGGMGGDASTGAAGEATLGGSGAVGCGDKPLSWKPLGSKVMLLMDRSGTMFDVDPKPWVSVRDAMLPVVDAYDAERSIGFMAMTGEAGTCPILDEVAPAPNNYAAIATKYTALTKPTKGESPFMLALSRARQLLDAAPAAEPFVIMVIDGAPDYCNDGDDLCPIDSVVARIQSLHAAGITTLIAGLPLLPAAGDAAVYAAALQSYANAGVGLPAASVGATEANIYFRCSSGTATPPSWPAEFAASGKQAQQALGTYSASPGGATFASLDPANPAGLTAAFSKLFARTHSCSFETTNGTVLQPAAGIVKLDNVAVNFDAANGWHMKSATELEFVGNACNALRASATAEVSIDFPCAAVGN